MQIRFALAISIFSTLPLSTATAEGNAENGRNLARAHCAHCHGFDGNARSTKSHPVPMLAGQPAVYLIKEMNNYVTGIRDDSSKNAAMTRVIKGLSETELADIAAYFEKQKRY